MIARRWPIVLAVVATSGSAWLVWNLQPNGPIKVVDGDTVDRNGLRHRLKGFDAPEIRQPKCKDERQRGIAARGRLEQLLANAKTVDLQPSLRLEKYGRMLSTLKIDGEDVATIATREGWGVRYHGGREPRPDWCFINVPLNIAPQPISPQ